MDAKEAIYRIQRHMVIHKLYEPHAVLITEALNTAIKALAQQEPVEPKPSYAWGMRSTENMTCGKCGKGIVSIHNDNYCPMCGRKVDWDAIR